MAESTKFYMENQNNIQLNITYVKWFEKFQSVKSENPVLGEVNRLNFSLLSDTNDFKQKIYLSLDKPDVFYDGIKGERYIKIDPSLHMDGDVVDSFGFIDSFLEKNLGLVMIPNMTESETSYESRFTKASDKFDDHQLIVRKMLKFATKEETEVAEKTMKSN